MKKIKEIQDRKKLMEGRNFGIGFSILNKISNNKYETYLPFTACKDYLNDFSYVEFNKKEIGSIYGHNHKLLNCFNKKRLFYLGVNTLNYKSGSNWQRKEEATKLLIDNKDNLQKLINVIENKIGINNSKIEVDEDTLIIKAPLYWMKSTALISVYTLIIRCFFNIEFDENKDLIEQMNNHKPFIQNDSYLKQNTISFINTYDKYNYTNINYNKYGITEKSLIHNFGIDGFLKKMNNG